MLFGALYGVLLYGIMNYVVVPLSAAGRGSRDPLWVVMSIAVHLFGVLPALRASKLAPFEVLKEEANRSSGSPRRGRLASALVVAQLSLCVVLLVAAGLFIRSLQKVPDTSPGFEADGVVLASVDVSPETGYSLEDGIAFQTAVLRWRARKPETRASSPAAGYGLRPSAPTDNGGKRRARSGRVTATLADSSQSPITGLHMSMLSGSSLAKTT